MEQRDKILEEYYAQMGIAKPVYDFCMKVEEELKDRFLSSCHAEESFKRSLLCPDNRLWLQ